MFYFERKRRVFRANGVFALRTAIPNMYRRLAETALKNVLVLADRLGLNPTTRRKMGGIEEHDLKAEKEYWERRAKYG